MDCWDRFGVRVLLTCDRYADRRPGAIAELKRVGLTVDEMENPYVGGLMGLEMAHRAAWTRFLESDAESMLIIEDDVRFLSDTIRLSRIVKALPDPFDEARLCWGGARGDAKAASGQIWAPVVKNRPTCYMTACYALSRRAARFRLDMSDVIMQNGTITTGIDLRLGMYPPGFAVYISVPPAAMVVNADGVSGNSARGSLLADAAQFGFSANDYVG